MLGDMWYQHYVTSIASTAKPKEGVAHMTTLNSAIKRLIQARSI